MFLAALLGWLEREQRDVIADSDPAVYCETWRRS
jgi:hypothetical protein